MLGAAPLLLTCVPHDLAAAVSRPRAVDRALLFARPPRRAVVTVTVLGTATLMPAVVGWGSGSGLATSVLALVTVAASGSCCGCPSSSTPRRTVG